MDALRKQPRRNKGFDETHREMIATAVRLISQYGSDGLSIAALAREMGINRTTIYYHFEHREALIVAVKEWAAGEIARGMEVGTTTPERIGYISHFVLENPELIKLWIDDFVSGHDIREAYPRWDEMVAGIATSFAALGQDIDAEVYCVTVLTSGIIGPRVFARSVRPDESLETVAAKFLREEQRVLRRDGLEP